MRPGLRTPAPRLWTIVLAAGGSRRFGTPKQLLRLGGRTLLHRAAATAAELTPGRVVVVLGAERLRLRRHLRAVGLGVAVASNARWQNGMAGSLAAGLRALPRSAAAALLLVTDQPLVRAGEIARLVRRWRARPERPVASIYEGRPGVPAIVPRRHFAALRNGSGDVGARRLLRTLPGVEGVRLSAAAFDIDTPEDLARLEKRPVGQRVAQLTQPLAPDV